MSGFVHGILLDTVHGVIVRNNRQFSSSHMHTRSISERVHKASTYNTEEHTSFRSRQ